jgi:hypothetical protein
MLKRHWHEKVEYGIYSVSVGGINSGLQILVTYSLANYAEVVVGWSEHQRTPIMAMNFESP